MLGIGGTSMSAQMLYRTTQATFDRQFETYSKQPLVERQIQYFRDKAPTKITVDDFLNDWQLRQFLLQSFGLEELQNSRALVERILTDDLDSEDALVWRMNDPRFVRMATTLRFDQGMGKLQFPNVVEDIVSRFKTNGFEAQVGDQNVAVRQAMYFKRRAPDLQNMYQILGDKALRDVAVTAAGLPPETARIDIDKQVKLLEENLDFKKLKDPEYLESYIQRYLARVDANSGPSSAQAGILQLFQPLSGGGGLSVNLLV
ncbi:MAG: DUF1217 domain-containing protein [Alphaproteobacteria bacterium]|jgi:hypothetical protein|nr:DUF1217 domain-containing protein [Alphaproteobacteria bacterium]